MSEEDESFVILGTSPYPSLCADGIAQLDDALHTDNKEVADGNTTITAKGEDGLPSASLTQLSISSLQPKSNGTSLQTSVETNGTNGTTGDTPKSLAASFILGEVNSGVLKNSVFSQFPSLTSMEACAEDVVKLQNLLTEHVALKQTLLKVNRTMEDYYKISQERYKEAAARELSYQEQVKSLREEIAQMREENQQLKDDLASKLTAIHVMEDMQNKEHQELRQSVSEKTSLIQNMRAEIDKLQQQQMHSFDFMPETNIEEAKEIKESTDEQTLKIKELEREMSKLMAENLEILDMKKVYIDEIDCLKVSLTSAEELIHKMQRDIHELRQKDAQKQEQIAHLQTQNDIYRRDFEMERADREKNAGEKEQYLLDLRALQRRNQELIEAMAQSHKNSSPSSSKSSSPSSSLRDNQRPVRVLDPTGAAAQTSSYALRCPICSKSFHALSVLQSHVNDCLDKN